MLPSLSRVMHAIVGEQHMRAASVFRNVLSTYEKNRDLISLGAYTYGSNAKIDYAMDKISHMETFLKQGDQERCGFESTTRELRGLFSDIEDFAA